MSETLGKDRLKKLDQLVREYWGVLLDRSPFINLIRQEKVDPRLYALYMVETYHYTKHNARNQALVGSLRGVSPTYQKFCFDHAAEESGHEFMALKDVVSLGIQREDVEKTEPLVETEALMAYLYWASLTGNPKGRLGYSFWAESVYEHINEVLEKIKGDLNLQPKQMTFFIAHSDIDAEHAEEVEHMLLMTCKTNEDWDAVEKVAMRSLFLTEKMLEGIHSAYLSLKEGGRDDLGYLNATLPASSL